MKIKQQTQTQYNSSFGRAPLPPTILTIFGATGDLAADYLLPAIFHMDMEGLLPEDFKLVCVGRRPLTTEKFLDFILEKSRVLQLEPTGRERRHFSRHVVYYQGDFDDPASFTGLSRVLDDQERPRHQCYNRLYYFATAQKYFGKIADILQQSGLLLSCVGHNRQVRVLVEKPFGTDHASARVLNTQLLKYFTEEQIYRIDHYQGKETVQNLVVARFANSIFEPLWNAKYIDHVEISVLEKDSAAGRTEFYDHTGALKDFVQNHLLQILALVAMDEPKELTTEHIRSGKLKVLRALRAETAQTVGANVVKGQYRGFIRDVGHTSKTETYVAIKAWVDLPRWRNVPFYLRTGKRLSKKAGEISVHFREPARCLFRGCAANVVTFQIQPDESVHLVINNKIPGFGIELHQSELEFSARKQFSAGIPAAYERLLLDLFQGDQRLFISNLEIEAAWKYIDSITRHWAKLPVHAYAAGGNGPAEAEEWITRDRREWWTK